MLDQNTKLDNRAYIFTLLQQTKKKVTDEQIEVASSFEDRKEINKFIFSIPEPTVEIPTLGGLSKILDIKINDEMENLRESIKRTIGAKLDDLLEYYDYIDDCLANVAGLQRQLAGLGYVSIDLEKTVIKVCENRFYEFLCVEGSLVKFITSDVVMSHKNQDAGIDMVVTMGKYLVEWGTEDNSITVKQYSGNIEVNGYYHPHISTCGTMCLGNGADAYVKAIKDGDIARALVIVQSILLNYNHESPYMGLHRFYWWERRDTLDLSQDKFYMRRQDMGFRIDAGKCRYSLSTVREEIVEEKTIWHVRVYRKYSSEKDIPIDGKLYAKSRNGRYVELDKGWIYES